MKSSFILIFLSIIFNLNIALFAEKIENKKNTTRIPNTPPINAEINNKFNITNNHAEHPLFKTEETYKIAEYIEKDNSGIHHIHPNTILNIGLFGPDGDLIKPLFTRNFESIDDHSIFINNVELKDLNQDKYMDIIINVTETNSNLYKTTHSYFFINTHDNFTRLDLFFNRNNYEFQTDSIIQVTEPLYAFGTPYENDSDSKDSPVWQNYYEFKGIELLQINARFRNYYETLHKNAKRLLNKQLQNIKNYQMSEESSELNQLQLNEYFHQITTQKIIIKRCEDVLFTL